MEHVHGWYFRGVHNVDGVHNVGIIIKLLQS